MQIIGPKPKLTPEAARAIARLLLRKAAEAEQAETTGPERLGDIATRAAAEIIDRRKHTGKQSPTGE